MAAQQLAATAAAVLRQTPASAWPSGGPACVAPSGTRALPLLYLMWLSPMLGCSVHVQTKIAPAPITTQSLASPRVLLWSLGSATGMHSPHWHSSPARRCHMAMCSMTFIRIAVQCTAEPAAELEQGGRLVQLWRPNQPGECQIASHLTWYVQHLCQHGLVLCVKPGSNS